MSHFIYCYAECRYYEYHYAECLYTECRYAECHYAECRYVECHYAECRYTECHYAECRGAFKTFLFVIANIKLGLKNLLGPTLGNFYGRNSPMILISVSVCPWQAFPVLSNITLSLKKPTRDQCYKTFAVVIY